MITPSHPLAELGRVPGAPGEEVAHHREFLLRLDLRQRVGDRGGVETGPGQHPFRRNATLDREVDQERDTGHAPREVPVHHVSENINNVSPGSLFRPGRGP